MLVFIEIGLVFDLGSIGDAARSAAGKDLCSGTSTGAVGFITKSEPSSGNEIKESSAVRLGVGPKGDASSGKDKNESSAGSSISRLPDRSINGTSTSSNEPSKFRAEASQRPFDFRRPDVVVVSCVAGESTIDMKESPHDSSDSFVAFCRSRIKVGESSRTN